MKARLFLFLLLLTAALCIKCADTYGQVRDTDTTEITQSIQAGNQYMDARIASLEQYVQHYAHIQKRLVKKLNKRERTLPGLHASPGKLPDTTYHRNDISSDSLLTLAKDPSLLYNKGSPKTNALVDSLKNIQHFLQNQSSKLQNTSTFINKAGLPTDYSARLATLQQKLNAQQQLSRLIKQKVSSLQSQAGGKKLSGLSSIQKDVAIAASKIQYWKQASSEPDAAEEKAYEYLQGTEGFESYLNNDQNAFGGLGNNATIADLQNMGYQTKGMVSGALNKKFGGNLANVQKQMSAQIAGYQKQLNEVQSKAKAIQNDYRQGKQQLAAAKDQLRHIEKPAFKNPMRGIPFWKRFKTQYNFQTTKATSDGNPALLNLGASLAFEQTPKWRWGIGTGAAIGLGKDWQHLHISYEGISLRAFLDREIIYGIALEGGYERRFQPAGRMYAQQAQTLRSSEEETGSVFKSAFGMQEQSAYLGLAKSYRINKKWNGTFLIGYDFLWQQYGRRSPLVIRLRWEK